ncbi:hypothetical protein Shyhy02_79270 [Streptomyces hygroscopicus subsp. hygroscopicus]|nr:hypothetical protein Shyhy02_79270 [Streptomyces hygroscopicus subsp. hygroscopicus]
MSICRADTAEGFQGEGVLARLARDSVGQRGDRDDDPLGDVAVWLLAPTLCAGRCEDGWHPAPPERPAEDDQPCSFCRGGWLLPRRGSSPHNGDNDQYGDEQGQVQSRAADRTPAQAVVYRPPHRECEGRGGTCGRPVADPYAQCPTCLGWPRCGCGALYDPNEGDACRTCFGE